MSPGERVRRTTYDLSPRELDLMPMTGTVVAIAGGIVEVQWDYRTKGRTNRYYADGLRLETAVDGYLTGGAP